MTRSVMEARFRRLLSFGGIDMSEGETRKLTAVLEREHHELLARISILEGISKTELIRRAIDAYANEIGMEVLFPARQ